MSDAAPADTPCYMLANFIVNDKDEYRKYEKGFFPILKRHNGTFYTYDDSPTHMEGESPRDGRVVIFGFPSEQAALDWYNDPEYQELSEFRRAGTTLNFITLIHGIPPRG